jgi:uncharacterized flavoprotein (TIGR03862 family)
MNQTSQFTKSAHMPSHTATDLYEIVIIGAGPAGLMAAQRLAEGGVRVTVYERMSSVGRKFLMAGRGGLNLTHSEPPDRFKSRYGSAASALGPIIDGFCASQLRAWAGDLGQELFVGSSGRVFPRAMKASPLLRAWLERLDKLGVQIRTGWRWTGWDADGALTFQDKPTVRPSATLLALGGASWARLGSDGLWQQTLVNHHVPITPLVASNVGVLVPWDVDFATRFAGMPLKGIAVSCGAMRARGDVIIKSDGLEGGPIYALSEALRTGLAHGGCQLELDFRPDLSLEALAARLAVPGQGKSVSTVLKSRLKLHPAAQGLIRQGLVQRGYGAILPSAPNDLAALVKATKLDVTALQPIERAISSAGGVVFSGVDEHLMIKALPGVFVAGEMLDWDAPTGGYLLQACFATGVRAAIGVKAYLEGR